MKTSVLKKVAISKNRSIPFVSGAKNSKSAETFSSATGVALSLKSLLVPIDFSDCSFRALKYANNLAKSSGGTIELLHVLPPARIPHGFKMHPADWKDRMTQNALGKLNQLSNEKIDELIPVHAEVRVGNSYEEICAVAARPRQDLIVIGTHGRKGLNHLLFGSTAERVVRLAPCSVLVVRGLDNNTTARLHPKKILVPVDFSQNSKMAIPTAIVLARQYQAAVILVYVLPSHSPICESDFFDYAMLDGDLRECAMRELRTISKKIGGTGISVSTEIYHGRPATEIVEAAKDYKADLIVISTHGRTGIEHTLLGSTTEEVVRRATCPVLALRGHKEQLVIPI